MPGNARLVGEQEKALGSSASRDVCCAQWLSGEHIWSLALSTTGSQYVVFSQVCFRQVEVQWSLPVPRRVGPYVLALQTLRLGRTSGVTSHLSPATCGHREMFVSCAPKGNGACCYSKAMRTVFWGYWYWWRHFPWTKRLQNGPFIFCAERRQRTEGSEGRVGICLLLWYSLSRKYTWRHFLCNSVLSGFKDVFLVI